MLVGDKVLLGLLNTSSSSELVDASAGIVTILTLIGIFLCLPVYLPSSLPACAMFAVAMCRQILEVVQSTVHLVSQLADDVTILIGREPSGMPSDQSTKRADYTRLTENDIDDVESASGYEPQPVLETYTVTFSELAAHGLPNTDVRGAADPYVVIRHGTLELVRTEDLRNALNGRVNVVRWPGVYTGRASSWQSSHPTIAVTVYDKESNNGADETSELLGRGTFYIRLTPGANLQQQQVSFPLSEVPADVEASISLQISITHEVGAAILPGGGGDGGREGGPLEESASASAPTPSPTPGKGHVSLRAATLAASVAVTPGKGAAAKGRVKIAAATLPAPAPLPAPAKVATTQAMSSDQAPASASAVPVTPSALAPAPAPCPVPATENTARNDGRLDIQLAEVDCEIRGTVAAAAAAPAVALCAAPAVVAPAAATCDDVATERVPSLSTPSKWTERLCEDQEPQVSAHRSHQPLLSSRSAKTPRSTERTPRPTPTERTPRQMPRTPRSRTTISPKQPRPDCFGKHDLSSNPPWHPLPGSPKVIDSFKAWSYEPRPESAHQPMASWRDADHAHRLQINFAVDLCGMTGDPLLDASLVPPPSEIAFVLAVFGADVQMPLADSVKVHRAVAVRPEAMKLPQDPDRLDYKSRTTVAGQTYDPFMLYACSTARTGDVLGYDDNLGVHDGIEICVHVPQELNPCLATSANSQFIFSRLGSCDCNGTHYAAHVALMMSLATRPLDSPETRRLASPDPDMDDEMVPEAARIKARRPRSHSMDSLMSLWLAEDHAEAEPLSAKEAHLRSLGLTGRGEVRDNWLQRPKFVPGLGSAGDGGSMASQPTAVSATPQTPSRKVPPVVPLLPTIPTEEVPSLAKSIAQLRLDSARRRQEDRRTELRLHTARWRAAEDQNPKAAEINEINATISAIKQQQLALISARSITEASSSSSGGMLTQRSALTARSTSATPRRRQSIVL